MSEHYEKHNVIVKNKKSGINQLISPSGIKQLMQDKKLAESVEIIGLADPKGRLIIDTKTIADQLYKSKMPLTIGKIVPVEDLKPNKDQGRDFDMK